MRGSIRRLLAAMAMGAGLLVAVPAPVSAATASTPACPTPVRATVHGKVLRSSALVAHRGACTPSRSRVGTTGSRWPRSAGSGASLYSGGHPPLLFHHGSVMGTTTPGEVTITPIFWTPPGFANPTASYVNLVDQLDADLAADSTLRTNVMSTLTDYTDAAGAHLSNVFHAGTPIMASDAAATSGVVAGETVVGCSPDSGTVVGAEGDQYSFSGCVTDVQIMAEVEAVRAQRGLPNDAAHLYPVFLPKGLQSCFGAKNGTQGGVCALNASSTRSQYCAYHSSVEAGGGAVYSVEPFPARSSGNGRCDLGLVTTGSPQAPNGDLVFDSAASPYSHEVAEAITDPYGDGWYDSVGNENGDECAYVVPASLGGTTGAGWDQTINGHHYLVQAEFSNVAFSWDGLRGCLMTAETPPPSITGLSTTRRAVGEQLTISGSNLDGGPVVRIGAQVATVVSATSTTVVATVPDGSIGGVVSVQTISGTSEAPTLLTIVPRSSPSFTSSAAVSAVTGSPVSATVTTTGYPVPSITVVGSLPTGLSLSDDGDGTAVLSGTPVAGTGGSWPITLSAQNSEGTTTQAMTIAVHEGPAFTSGALAAFEAGHPGSFTVTTAGVPAPSISMTGQLPKGLAFTAKADGTATISGQVGGARIGTYAVTLHAVNGGATSDVQTLTLVVGRAPKVKAALKVPVVRGALLSTVIATTGSPIPTISVLGLESWMHLTTRPDGTATLSGRAPTGGVARYITLAIVGRNVLGTTNRTMFVRLR